MDKTTQQKKKSMVGLVVSDKMTKTVVVKVTTFKQHPLYHKRFRWTEKYLADTAELTPKVGDTVKIEASKPLSKLKRWQVSEVVKVATAVKIQAVKKAAVTTAAQAKTPAKASKKLAKGKA